jgi:hypothetical protein
MGAVLHMKPASAMNLEPICTLQFSLLYFMIESRNATLQLITKPAPSEQFPSTLWSFYLELLTNSPKNSPILTNQ